MSSLSDFINGKPGSWRDAMRTISYISHVFPGKDSVCALGCVLSPYNLEEIEAVLEFATEIGWWLSLVPAHITPVDRPMNFRGSDETFSFSREDHPKLRALLDRLKLKKRRGMRLFDSDDYLDSIYHFVTTGSPNWRKNGICDSPNLYFAILPDGRFAPCCDFRLDQDVYLDDPDFPRFIGPPNSARRSMVSRDLSRMQFREFPRDDPLREIIFNYRGTRKTSIEGRFPSLPRS